MKALLGLFISGAVGSFTARFLVRREIQRVLRGLRTSYQSLEENRPEDSWKAFYAGCITTLDDVKRLFEEKGVI